jgi:serine/threonine protein kinase
LRRQVDSAGPLVDHELRALAAGLAEALVAIHRMGVVHRDLSPNNVLLSAEGPRVVDFGIASYAEATALSQTGTALGTPAWMAPEQVVGDATGPAADVFAWGALMAYASTGKPPFGEGRAEAVVYRVVHDEPNLEAVPDWLRPSVQAAMTKSPGSRPSALALLDAFADRDTDLHSGVTETLRRDWTVRLVDPGSPAEPPPRRRSLPWAAAFLTVAVALVGGILYGLRTVPETSNLATRSTSTTQRLTTTTRPERSAVTAATKVPAPDPMAARFNRTSGICRPSYESDIHRTWQVSVSADDPYGSADASVIYPADRLELGLRNRDAALKEGHGLNLPIRVTVIDPDGTTDVLSTYLQGEQWALVQYPASPYDMDSGTHTVIWTTDDGRYIACDGFFVEEFFGE